jgi:hypothetical protein
MTLSHSQATALLVRPANVCFAAFAREGFARSRH